MRKIFGILLKIFLIVMILTWMHHFTPLVAVLVVGVAIFFVTRAIMRKIHGVAKPSRSPWGVTRQSPLGLRERFARAIAGKGPVSPLQQPRIARRSPTVQDFLAPDTELRVPRE